MEIDGATIERLARRIHENYLTEHAPSGRRWDDLTEDLREANRAQARDIAGKLAAIGATVQPGADPTPFAFTQTELDRLADAAHRPWMEQSNPSGWTCALVRD